MKKSWRCKLGFHSLFVDTIMGYDKLEGDNYMFWTKESYDACNYCNYRKRRY